MPEPKRLIDLLTHDLNDDPNLGIYAQVNNRGLFDVDSLALIDDWHRNDGGIVDGYLWFSSMKAALYGIKLLHEFKDEDHTEAAPKLIQGINSANPR